MRSPFKFLDSYGIRDKEVFFGREKEVDALYNLVFKTPLTLVYGLSGTGKTSIIQCGLGNRFEGPDWLPFFIRREQNINQSLRNALTEALDVQTDKALPDLINNLFDEYLRPVYLIFDQFEELFILGTPEEQAIFADSLRLLTEQKLPCRVILIIREEYLGQLYPLEKEIPTLFDYRLRIEPMKNAHVLQVLEKSFQAFNIATETPEEVLRQAIIDNVSAGRSGIQLPYLQVYLDILYREDYFREYGERERGDDLPLLTFTHEEIEAFGKIDEVLEKFLQEQTKVLQAELIVRHPGLAENAVRLILDAFVTEDGTKRPIALHVEKELLEPEAQFTSLFPDITLSALTDCLHLLEQSRLLRISDNSAELAHDSLAQLIDGQRTKEQRQLNEVKRRIAAAHLAGVWLSELQLLSMEELLPKINLEPHLLTFIQDCYAEAIRIKEAAKKEQQQKLEEAQQHAEQERTLREKAEVNENQARQRTRLAAMVSVLALVAAVAAGYFWLMAYQKTEEAKKAFDDLQRIADQAVPIVLTDIDRDIYRLDYDSTYEKCRTAMGLNARRPEVEKRIWEIAYFYNEADSVAAAVAFLNLLKPDGFITETPNLQIKLRDYFAHTLPAPYLDFLQRRYYPHMVKVGTGTFLKENKKDSLRVEKPFLIGETEINYWQYNLFARAEKHHIEPPSWGFAGDNPALYVSWYDALFYCNWLSKQHGKKTVYTLTNPRSGNSFTIYDVETDTVANGYRLPAEAQWEFAARGGQYSQGYSYSGDSNPDTVAWYEGNSNNRTQAVKQKKPNELGLYDMSGNVLECCSDLELEGSRRVIRGGSWFDNAENCRTVYRTPYDPRYRYNSIGFRLVFVPQ